MLVIRLILSPWLIRVIQWLIMANPIVDAMIDRMEGNIGPCSDMANSPMLVLMINHGQVQMSSKNGPVVILPAGNNFFRYHVLLPPGRAQSKAIIGLEEASRSRFLESQVTCSGDT